MASMFRDQKFNITAPGITYSLFFLGLIAMAFSLIVQQWLLFVIVMLLPIGIMILLYTIEKPMLSFLLFATITCYFSAIYRYSRVEMLSGILDILLGICLFSIFINTISNRYNYPWKQAINVLTVTHFVWISYCFLILLTPHAYLNDFISTRSVFLTLPLTYILCGILLCTTKQVKITLLLLGAFVVTAAFKAYWQKRKGFDSYEIEWLVSGAWHTHLLTSGIRYFSFFTDAGNFGSSMGLFTIVFALVGIAAKKRTMRLFFLGVAVLAWIGMMMSGTRGAMIVPFGGIALYLLVSKNIKMITTCTILGAIVFCFFYFTNIGDGNAFIKRMRTAFRPTEDASFNVRLENQKRFAYYLADKPFGVGVGGHIVDTKGITLLDEDYIPTDSFYVGKWVEGGIVGLCLYISLQVLVLLRCCYLLMFKIKNKQLRQILTALLCGVFGIWLNGYVGRGMEFQPSSFIIAIFLSFVLNGTILDRQLKENETII